MPKTWIDKDTGHKITRLAEGGENYSFYFTNNPFWSHYMLYTRQLNGKSSTWKVNLKTMQSECLVKDCSSEVFCKANKKIYIKINSSLVSIDVRNGKRRVISNSLPKNLELQSVNCNGSKIVGFLTDSRENALKRISKNREQWMKASEDSCLHRYIFVVDTRTGKGESIYDNTNWINHIQFSPTDPNLLMFCHEGDWLKVDRIWTMDIRPGHLPILMHKRSVEREACGHEAWTSDGKSVYYDHQIPGHKDVYITFTYIKGLKEKSYAIDRKSWSLHYHVMHNKQAIVGDGSIYGKDGKWIFLYEPDITNKLKSRKLVNMKNHNYKLEPNVQPSLDNRFVVFRANFEGFDGIYSVDI